MSQPIELQSVIEIYITNECNLTCSDCNRFNNYNFDGHLDWRASESALLSWGQRITAPLITIIGGEPTMHPELFDWVKLVRRAWPDKPLMVQTNGTIHHPDRDSCRALDDFGFVASVHHTGMQKTIVTKNTFPDGLVIDMIDNTRFTECAVIDRDTHFEVHDSDPEAAFQVCGMKHSHTILNGYLYKCPLVAVLPEFVKQHEVKLTDRQKNLLQSYNALHHDCTDTELDAFVNNTHSSIPQCTLCPDRFLEREVNFDPKRKHRQKKIIPISQQPIETNNICQE